jgi:hypothetical protein
VIPVDVSTDRPFETGDATAESRSNPSSERLRAMYRNRLDVYDRELSTALGIEAYQTGLGGVSQYPQLPITIDVPETLIIDGNLFTCLFDVYSVHGWPGIVIVESALRQLAQPESGAPAGGTVVSQWPPAWSFFVFTRNLLALMIRDSLIEIERLAATRIIADLSNSAVFIARGWDQFRLTRVVTKVPTRTALSDNVTYTDNVTYAFGDKDLSKALYKALTDAVTSRVDFELLLNNITHAGDEIRQARAKLQPSGGQPDPKSEQQLAALLADEKGLKDIEQATSGFYASMSAVIYMNCPLALLVLDGLTPGFTQPQMEQLVGEALWPLYARIDQLAAGIDPQRSRAALDLPGYADAASATPDAIARLSVGLEGPEASLIDGAVAGLPDDPAYIALLHEPTLNTIVETGGIDRDSLPFVVYFHYVTTLIDRMETQRQQEENAAKFWAAFGKIAAAISLVSLVVQPELVPLLQGGVAIADLVMLASSVRSVVQQLSGLDQALSTQLVGPNAFALESLQRVAQLGAFRRELVNQITEQILLQLVGIVAGASWVPIKKLLLASGYYLDLQTLLSDG